MSVQFLECAITTGFAKRYQEGHCDFTTDQWHLLTMAIIMLNGDLYSKVSHAGGPTGPTGPTTAATTALTMHNTSCYMMHATVNCLLHHRTY